MDLYYAFTGGPAPFAEELATVGQASSRVRVHLVDSALEGRLNAERIMAEAVVDPAQLSVFLCGPTSMLRDLQKGPGPRRPVPQRPPGLPRLATTDRSKD